MLASSTPQPPNPTCPFNPSAAGKYVDRDLVEKPLGASVLFFGFVVVATALASFAPQVYKGEGPDARSFGPFTPKAELSNGR